MKLLFYTHVYTHVHSFLVSIECVLWFAQSQRIAHTHIHSQREENQMKRENFVSLNGKSCIYIWYDEMMKR